MSEPLAELRIIDALRSLTDSGIDFIVFGQVAAGLHGHVRATRDLDIIIEPSSANIDRTISWLRQADAHLGSDPATALRPRDERALHLGSNAFVVTRFGRLDIVRHIAGMPEWSELEPRALHVELDGMTIKVMDRETLIERKRARSSPQDLLDIAALEEIAGADTP